MFIHNANHYFVNLPVYADGLIDAWELLDVPLFTQKVRSGWVTPRVPDTETISVHGLGTWRIADGRWDLTPDALLDLVNATIGRLNPDRRNLHDCAGQTTKKVGKMNVSILGTSRPVAVRADGDSPLSSLLPGKSLSLWCRQDDRVWLSDMRVFKDGSVELGRLPRPLTLNRGELQAMAAAGEVLTDPPVGQRVCIHGLGSFVIDEAQFTTDLDQLLLEISDVVDTLNDRPDAIARCRQRFSDFQRSPTPENKEELRRAYEAIPEHNRMYVGDMDTKDIPIRMVLYGEEEIESWSHRAVARAQGVEPLPTIEVPTVDPEPDS